MATAMMDTMHPYPESPPDPEDVSYPCKGCGEVRSIQTPYLTVYLTKLTQHQILEEGKAFELGKLEGFLTQTNANPTSW